MSFFEKLFNYYIERSLHLPMHEDQAKMEQRIVAWLTSGRDLISMYYQAGVMIERYKEEGNLLGAIPFRQFRLFVESYCNQDQYRCSVARNDYVSFVGALTPKHIEESRGMESMIAEPEIDNLTLFPFDWNQKWASGDDDHAD